ncbi:KTSC domain-containing protein [Paenibacillus sp. D51F]
MSSVGYDAASRTLYVRFLTGALYAYAGVPPHEHANLMAASSHGSYLSANIKDRYPYRRIG